MVETRCDHLLLGSLVQLSQDYLTCSSFLGSQSKVSGGARNVTWDLVHEKQVLYCRIGQKVDRDLPVDLGVGNGRSANILPLEAKVHLAQGVLLPELCSPELEYGLWAVPGLLPLFIIY